MPLFVSRYNTWVRSGGIEVQSLKEIAASNLLLGRACFDYAMYSTYVFSCTKCPYRVQARNNRGALIRGVTCVLDCAFLGRFYHFDDYETLGENPEVVDRVQRRV